MPFFNLSGFKNSWVRKNHQDRTTNRSKKRLIIRIDPKMREIKINSKKSNRSVK